MRNIDISQCPSLQEAAQKLSWYLWKNRAIKVKDKTLIANKKYTTDFDIPGGMEQWLKSNIPNIIIS
jgi:hypothetical protein